MSNPTPAPDPTPITSATAYERPVAASLHVHLENGETFAATADDLAKFGLIARRDAYMNFRKKLFAVLTEHDLLDDRERRDLVDTEINPLRHFVETVLNYPELLDHPDNDAWKDIADIERRLRATPADG